MRLGIIIYAVALLATVSACSQNAPQEEVFGARLDESGAAGPEGSLLGLTEYHWAIPVAEPKDLVTRMLFRFSQDAACTILYRQNSERSEQSWMQSLSHVDLPDGTSPREYMTVQFDGEAQLTYADQVGFRSVERRSSDFYESTNAFVGELTAGDLILTQLTSSLGETNVPARLGSISCDKPFDILDATWGTEVSFGDITNATGVAVQNSLVSASRVSLSMILESPLSGVLLYIPDEAGVATLTHPNGNDYDLSSGLREYHHGQGSYDAEITVISEQGKWFVAGYGMDRTLDLNAIRISSSPFQEICVEDFCFYL